MRSRRPLIALSAAVAIVAVAAVVVAVVLTQERPGSPSVSAPVEASSSAAPMPSPTPSPTPTTEPGFAGQWAGDILGDSHPYSVSVTMAETDGVVSGTAVYPEIPCEGTWAQSSRVGSTAIVIETMPTTNVCYDQVAITLILASDGTISYTAQSGPYLITSTLVRTG